MSAASRRRGNAASGLSHGHRVEPGPERGDLLALAFRREMQRRGEGVLNERVLLHGRPDHAGRDLHGGHEVRRPRQDLVGRVVLFVGLDAAVTGPGPRLGSGNDDGVGAAARHQRQRVVDHLLLGDADLAEERARPGRADAPGDGARRVGERPRALRHGDGVDVAEQPRCAGVHRCRRHRVGHQVHDGRRVVGGAEPDQDGEARVEGAHRSGHDARCYGPAMAQRRSGQVGGRARGFHQGILRSRRQTA